MKDFMTISEFARAGGVGVETIRFYHRRGLLPVPKAMTTTYRTYNIALLQQLRFIRSLQVGGFTLQEIKQLMAYDALYERQKIQDIPVAF